MSARPPEQDWFEKAEQDLKMGRRTMDPEDALPAMACYHCQPGRGAGSAGDVLSRTIEDLTIANECATSGAKNSSA